MTEAAHTPGPWTADLGDHTRTSEIWAGEMLVADVHGHVTQGSHADTRLIAAAPELLASLADLLNDPAVIEAAQPLQIGRALLAIHGAIHGA